MEKITISNIRLNTLKKLNTIHKMTDNILPQKEKNESELIINDKNFKNSKNVVEEEYTEHSEALLKFWLKQAEKARDLHNKKGKSFKFKHEVTALPASLLPIMYSPISGLLSDEDGIEIANVIVLISTGLLSGIHSFFDYGRKSQKHFEYEAKYGDLATTILVELSKKRDIRIRADRFIEMVQSKIDNFAANAPLL